MPNPPGTIPARDVTDVMKSSYISPTDPADNPANSVLPGKRWAQTNANGDIIAEKIRNLANTAWLTIPNSSNITGQFIKDLLGITTLTGVNTGDQNISTKADLVNGKVPVSQLPEYLDDVLEFANQAAFPATGESGKLYIDLSANPATLHRWTGSAYVNVGAATSGGGLVLGETLETAYRGDRGKEAYDHAQITNGNPHGANTDQITEGANNKYVNSTEKTKLANLSGTNTGDQDLSGLAQSSEVVKLSGNQIILGAKTFTSQILVPADAYDASAWDGKLEAATKDAVRDKFVAVEQSIANAGGGDMLKSAYDTNNDGKVNSADNADNLGGTAASQYATKIYADAVGSGKQNADADLTAIAALDSTQTGVIGSDGGGWLRKTYAQLKTALGLVKADVGLSNVPNTDATQRANHTGTQGLATISGITATRLLGRQTSGFGSAEEIQIGSNLTLSGGVLSAADSTGLDAAGVRNTSLTGLGAGTSAPIAIDDTILSAFAKTKYQIAIIESEYINIKRSLSPGQTDITTALNNAIAQIAQSSPTKGGKIYIPRGDWTTSGNHIFDTGILIEGDGYSVFANDTGTKITLITTTANQCIFRLNENKQNVRLKNMALNVPVRIINQGQQNQQEIIDGVGFLVSGTIGNFHLKNEIENVGFFGARYGIKIESAIINDASTNFQDVQTHLQMDGFGVKDCSFIGCRTAFYSNTINCSYDIQKPLIGVPTIDTARGFSTGGIAFEIPFCGTLVVKNYLIYGTGQLTNQPQTNGSTILYTIGQFNKIVFEGGQDEALQYFYRNAGNAYANHPIRVSNSTVQSEFNPSGASAYVIDSCKLVNAVGYPTFTGASAAVMGVTMIGQSTVETRTVGNPGIGYVGGEIVESVLTGFGNAYSRLYNEDRTIGERVVKTDFQPFHEINTTQGAIPFRGSNTGTAQTVVDVYNNLLGANVIGSTCEAWIRPTSLLTVSAEVFADFSFIRFTLSGASTTDLSVGFNLNLGKLKF